MISLRLSVMLILIMAIAPVMAAFGHYSEIAGRLLAAPIVVAADDADISVSAHADHCQADKSRPASCGFHVCVDCAITSSFGFVPAHSPAHYRYPEKPTSISLFVLPDIKPPIVL